MNEKCSACGRERWVAWRADGQTDGMCVYVSATVCAAANADALVAKAVLVAPLHYEANPEAGDGQSVCDGCGEERDEPHTWRECADRLTRLQIEGVNALVEQALREEAEIQRDEARAALAGEPARIAAAKMAVHVAWVRACSGSGGMGSWYIQRVLGIAHHAAVELATNVHEDGPAATDADIAAAIRAALGQS